jgi:hypothetical protein
MRASEEIVGIQTGGGWACKLAAEAQAWRSRRSQAPEIARGGVQVVRLPDEADQPSPIGSQPTLKPAVKCVLGH